LRQFGIFKLDHVFSSVVEQHEPVPGATYPQDPTFRYLLPEGYFWAANARPRNQFDV
jgi:hypothetical protein